MALNNEDLLLNFPPFIRKNIEELLLNGKIGLIPVTFNDIATLSPPMKQNAQDNTIYNYHFALKIPYAGKRLSWEVIFNPEDPNFPPDFDFNDNFLMSSEIDIITNNIPSLVNWNVENSKSLSSVLGEIIKLYKKTQLELIQKENIFSRINNEYKLLTTEIISPEDIEFCVDQSSLHFLIKINVDCSSLPEYLQSHRDLECGIYVNPRDDIANLRISFMKLDASHMNTSLHFSSRLEQVLGSAQNLHIPIYAKDTSLMEYVNLIIEMLNNLVKDIEVHHKLKKDFINCLVSLRGKSVIEFDADTFSKAVFLYEIDDYYCLIHINIDKKFPHKKPAVVLHSVYCLNSRKPCTETVNNYPYSPRWEPDIMLKRLLGHIADTVSKFKHHKH